MPGLHSHSRKCPSPQVHYQQPIARSPCWLGRELARSSKSAELPLAVLLESLEPPDRGWCRCLGTAKLVDMCDRLGLPRGSPVGPLGDMVLRLGGCSESWLLSDGVSRGTGMGRPLTQTKRGLPLQQAGMWQVSRCGTFKRCWRGPPNHANSGLLPLAASMHGGVSRHAAGLTASRWLLTGAGSPDGMQSKPSRALAEGCGKAKPWGITIHGLCRGVQPDSCLHTWGSADELVVSLSLGGNSQDSNLVCRLRRTCRAYMCPPGGGLPPRRTLPLLRLRLAT